MRINSVDNKNWLSIERKIDEVHAPFRLEASVNLESGVFNGKNRGVHFLNFAEFAKNYDAFISNRELTPTLNGTYDSYIKFEVRRDNSVFICFSIGDSFSGYSETVDFSLNGEFEINKEYLNKICKEFKKLAKNA